MIFGRKPLRHALHRRASMSAPSADLVPDAADALVRSFGGVPEGDVPETLEALRRYLEGHVARLLDQNPALLMSILYRVDVAERDVQRALRTSPPDRLPRDVADLLIERQLVKVRLRRAHRAR